MNTGKFTVAQNSAFTLATQIACYALNFLSGVIIARNLGPAGKGTLTLVVLTHVLLLTVSNLGLAAACSFMIAKRGFSLGQVSLHAMAAALGLGLVTFGLTAVVVNFLPVGPISPNQRGYVLLAAGLAPLALTTQFLSGALQGAGQIVWLNGLTLAQAIINAAGLALFLLVLRLGLPGGLSAWSVTTISTCLLTVFIALWRARRLGSRTARGAMRWNRALASEAFHYGIRAYPSGVVSFLNLRSDQFLLGYLAGAASVGVYSVAVTIAELMLFFPRALAAALLPRITGADSVSARHMAASACRHTMGGALISGAALVPIGLLIPLLFGEVYRPAVVPFLLLLPGLGAYALVPVLSTYISGQLGRPIVTSLFAALSLAIDLLLVLVLAPRLAVAGAALASTLAYAATSIAMVTYFRRLIGASLREMFAIRSEDIEAYHAVFAPLLQLRSARRSRR